MLGFGQRGDIRSTPQLQAALPLARMALGMGYPALSLSTGPSAHV